MLLSLYTYVRNSLYYDFHIVDMLTHHLPLADEIIVYEGYSDDGTYEAIKDIDPKIRIVRSRWDKPGKSYNWYVTLKERARQECRGQWCLHLDADEFVPEWEFEGLREFVASHDGLIVPIRVIDFYGNYKVYSTNSPCWRKMNLHRNVPEVEFWGDGANVRLKGQPFDWGSGELRFTCHHFGSVRHAARLREKWHIQGKMYGKGKRLKLPGFLFNLFPHRWIKPELMDGLEVYEGPYIKAVRENPSEFVRDGFALYDYLQERQSARKAAR